MPAPKGISSQNDGFKGGGSPKFFWQFGVSGYSCIGLKNRRILGQKTQP
jgi:hypothetical protein